jgi:hypothetical protein
LKPNEGIGALTPDSVRALAVQTEDPDGGLPWGLRLATTTRKLGCLEAARLQDGKLGVLGRDGAFANDGRFHPIPDSAVVNPTCIFPDAAGRLIGSVVYGGLPASASRGQECHAPQSPAACRRTGCVIRRASGSSTTASSARRRGASSSAGRNPDRRRGGRVPDRRPHRRQRLRRRGDHDVPEQHADHRDPLPRRHVLPCRCRRPGGGVCLPGLHPARAARREVTAPIRVKTWKTGKRWHARISFRAPVAIPDAGTAYSIRLSVPSKKSRGRAISTATQENVKQGETVVFQFDHLGGHGRYHGEVTYQKIKGSIYGSPRDGLRVGRVSFRLP